MSRYHQELDALAAWVRKRKLDPDDVCALFAAACGFTIAGSITTGTLTADEAERVINQLRERMRQAAGLCGRGDPAPAKADHE